MIKNYTAFNEKDTREITLDICSFVRKNDIILLIGNLGVGKTVVSKFLIEEISGIFDVVSPTFSLVNEYRGEVNVFHFDLYRIEKFDDDFVEWFREYLSLDGVIIVEWGDSVFSFIDRPYLKIEIYRNILIDENFRTIKVSRIENTRN